MGTNNTKRLLLAIIVSVRLEQVAGIFGGTIVTDPKDNFHLVFLTTTERSIFCHGAIIDQYYVLTTSQCVYDIRDNAHHILVVTGGFKLYNPEHEAPYMVEKVIIHYGYQFQHHGEGVKNFHDIALLKTTEPIVFNQYVEAAHLPSHKDKLPEDGEVAGWGRHDNSSGISGDLRTVLLRIKIEENCSAYFTPPDIINWQSTTWLCADSRMAGPGHLHERGPCINDKGAPLIWKNEYGLRVIFGLVSFHSGTNCNADAPFLFTWVPEYTDWIRDVSGINVELRRYDEDNELKATNSSGNK